MFKKKTECTHSYDFVSFSFSFFLRKCTTTQAAEVDGWIIQRSFFVLHLSSLFPVVLWVTSACNNINTVGEHNPSMCILKH